MDLGTLITLGDYGLKAAIEVGRKIKTLNTTEVDSGITEAYQCALSDWSQHAPTSSDELRLNAALDGYLKNATSYEVLDKDTKDFIDRFKKRLSEQPAAHNFLMMLRADEQAKSEEVNLQEHRKTQELLQGLVAQMEGLNITPQELRALLKELPLKQGRKHTESALEDMLIKGRIHSEREKGLIAEFVQFLFEHTDKITEEAMQLREAGDSFLAETLEEIKKVLTGESEQSLTAIYEKFKEQERQNEVKALEELIEAAQIALSFMEARDFYERLIELSPTIENHFDYARMLQSLNDFGKARSHYEEALQVLRELVEKDSETYKPDLAGTLNNLGNLLSDTNELKQAKAYHEEAMQIRRELAKMNPEAYRPYLADTLNNLGRLLSDTNELKQAKAYYEEARLIYKELAEMNPEAYKPDLAMILNNLGNLLYRTNKLKQAGAYLEEAMQIRRELAEMNPEAYRPDLANTLNNLGELLFKTNELKRAKAYYEEARLIWRESAEKNPEAYKPNLANTLNNLTILYLQLGKKEEAEWAYQEAYTIYQGLANLLSKADEIDYAKTLVTGVIMLGRPLENLGEAKAILSKYPEHLETQELLSFIEAHSKEVKAILSKYPEYPEAQGLLSFIEGLSKRGQ